MGRLPRSTLGSLQRSLTQSLVLFHFILGRVCKNSESDPSEVNRNRLVAKRNDVGGNIGKCKEYSRIDFCSEKPSKSLQNTLFYALVSIICGGKPLITTNKLVGPVGKKGVLGGVYRLRNA